MSLILDTWDLTSNFVTLGSMIQNTREYLKAALKMMKYFSRMDLPHLL
jgi:hypothetical protein